MHPKAGASQPPRRYLAVSVAYDDNAQFWWERGHHLEQKIQTLVRPKRPHYRNIKLPDFGDCYHRQLVTLWHSIHTVFDHFPRDGGGQRIRQYGRDEDARNDALNSSPYKIQPRLSLAVVNHTKSARKIDIVQREDVVEIKRRAQLGDALAHGRERGVRMQTRYATERREIARIEPLRVVNRNESLGSDGFEYALLRHHVQNAIFRAMGADVTHITINSATVGRHHMQHITRSLRCARRHCVG